MAGRAAFVLAATLGGPMIVSRLDYQGLERGTEVGVGFGVLETGAHEPEISALVADIAWHRRETAGPGVTIIDGGANIGCHTVAWARYMGGNGMDEPAWGKVVAFEPQEWLYYALCGNIALNNCFNAAAARYALGRSAGHIMVPFRDPNRPTNFGGVSLVGNEPGPGQSVQQIAIDDLNLPRLDVIKLDIEGMEPDALDGMAKTIARLRPAVIVEWIKCGKEEITKRLPGYEAFPLGMEMLCLHKNDPAIGRLKFVGAAAA